MSLAQRVIVRLYMFRGCSSGSGDRCTRLWLSRSSQGAFLEGVYPPLCAFSGSCRCSSGSRDRCTRLWVSRSPQGAFLLGVYLPSCAKSRSCRYGWVRPAYRNIVRSRHDNARVGCTGHPLAHVISRALDRKAVYVLLLLLRVG